MGHQGSSINLGHVTSEQKAPQTLCYYKSMFQIQKYKFQQKEYAKLIINMSNCCTFFFGQSFNLWRLFLIIVLYHQTKTPISFWCRWRIEPYIPYSTIKNFTNWVNWNPLLGVSIPVSVSGSCRVEVGVFDLMAQP